MRAAIIAAAYFDYYFRLPLFFAAMLISVDAITPYYAPPYADFISLDIAAEEYAAGWLTLTLADAIDAMLSAAYAAEMLMLMLPLIFAFASHDGYFRHLAILFSPLADISLMPCRELILPAAAAIASPPFSTPIAITLAAIDDAC
jgi:hypothetical protein